MCMLVVEADPTEREDREGEGEGGGNKSGRLSRRASMFSFCCIESCASGIVQYQLKMVSSSAVVVMILFVLFVSC